MGFDMSTSVGRNILPDERLAQLSFHQVLSLTLWAEARNQPFVGIMAVGLVIRNRLRQQIPRFGLTWSEVCLKPLQFSCWTDHGRNGQELAKLTTAVLNGQVILDPDWGICLQIAKEVMQDLVPDFLRGADHYLTLSLYTSNDCPSWARRMSPMITLGGHIFLSEKGVSR